MTYRGKLLVMGPQTNKLFRTDGSVELIKGN